MKKYEYKIVSVPIDKDFKSKVGVTFEKCKQVIFDEANNGWRLKQIVMPVSEKMGINSAYCYEIIFEKEQN